MGFYRKRPIIIEAITFNDFLGYQKSDVEKRDGLPIEIEYKGVKILLGENGYLIPTLEGVMTFTKNDMLITGVKEEIYPCKMDIFEATYEQVATPVLF